jgi:hypothetical protein
VVTSRHLFLYSRQSNRPRAHRDRGGTPPPPIYTFSTASIYNHPDSKILLLPFLSLRSRPRSLAVPDPNSLALRTPARARGKSQPDSPRFDPCAFLGGGFSWVAAGRRRGNPGLIRPPESVGGEMRDPYASRILGFVSLCESGP